MSPFRRCGSGHLTQSSGFRGADVGNILFRATQLQPPPHMWGSPAAGSVAPSRTPQFLSDVGLDFCRNEAQTNSAEIGSPQTLPIVGQIVRHRADSWQYCPKDVRISANQGQLCLGIDPARAESGGMKAGSGQTLPGAAPCWCDLDRSWADVDQAWGDVDRLCPELRQTCRTSGETRAISTTSGRAQSLRGDFVASSAPFRIFGHPRRRK